MRISNPEVFYPHFYDHGIELYESQKKQVQKRLKDYALDGEVISAAKLEDDWFPNIEANVFISHSHRDQKTAIGLAGWMRKRETKPEMITGMSIFFIRCEAN